jgi:AAA+ ATPase superfamily predicted ATPase
MKEKPLNPFPLHGYFGPLFFCDRESEKNTLLEALRNGRNVTLFAPRRLGKTGLLRHAFHYLPTWNCIYIDVQEAVLFKDFTNLFLASILNGLTRNKTLFKKFQDWILALRPVLSTDPHTGSFQLEVDFKSDSLRRTTINDALHLLDKAGPGVVALDEFQHIHTWGDELTTEGWLRAEMQKLKNVRFVFSGSQFHLISEIFNSIKRPFYASTQSMNIGKIETDVYHHFIIKQFSAYGVRISPDDVTTILSWSSGNTYNVQLLCNRVFSKSQKIVKLESINQAIVEIYSESQLSYFALRNSMQKFQWQVLAAIAMEGMVFTPTGGDFLKRYDLTSGPAVLRALKYLTDRELVYEYLTEQGENYYQVYDIILMRWLQKK